MVNVPGGCMDDGAAERQQDGIYRFLHGLTGKPLMVNAGFGVSTQANTWSTVSAVVLNPRVADGVGPVVIHPMPGSYRSQLATLAPELDSTCD
jgi:hypothetical protein